MTHQCKVKPRIFAAPKVPLGSRGCQYYVKQGTPNPRICMKSAQCDPLSCYQNNRKKKFNPSGLRETGFRTDECILILCTKHCDIVQRQIKKQIANSSDYEYIQMISLLHNRKDEFLRFTKSEEKQDHFCTDLKATLVGSSGPKRSPEKTLECPICLETYSAKNMHFLSCAHSFCNVCLGKLQSQNVELKCPICRQV